METTLKSAANIAKLRPYQSDAVIVLAAQGALNVGDITKIGIENSAVIPDNQMPTRTNFKYCKNAFELPSRRVVGVSLTNNA